MQWIKLIEQKKKKLKINAWSVKQWNKVPIKKRAIICQHLPYKACTLFHDFLQTKSMADMLHFAQQIDPMYPTEHQHRCIDTYQHKKDLLKIRQSVLHCACNAQEWKESYMFVPNHLKHTNNSSFTTIIQLTILTEQVDKSPKKSHQDSNKHIIKFYAFR